MPGTNWQFNHQLAIGNARCFLDGWPAPAAPVLGSKFRQSPKQDPNWLIAATLRTGVAGHVFNSPSSYN
jgi:hypothetical protein